jgi:hypothetical protein
MSELRVEFVMQRPPRFAHPDVMRLWRGAKAEQWSKEPLHEVGAPSQKSKTRLQAANIVEPKIPVIQPALRQMLVEEMRKIDLNSAYKETMRFAGKVLHHTTMMPLPLCAPDIR